VDPGSISFTLLYRTSQLLLPLPQSIEDFRFHDALLNADFWLLFAVTVIDLE
jgi:hypothetical protein